MYFRFLLLLVFSSWLVYGLVAYTYDFQAVITLLFLLCISIFLLFNLKHQAKMRCDSEFVYIKKPFNKKEKIPISNLISIEANLTHTARAHQYIVKYKREFEEVKMVFVDFDEYELSKLLNYAEKLGV